MNSKFKRTAFIGNVNLYNIINVFTVNLISLMNPECRNEVN